MIDRLKVKVKLGGLNDVGEPDENTKESKKAEAPKSKFAAIVQSKQESNINLEADNKDGKEKVNQLNQNLSQFATKDSVNKLEQNIKIFISSLSDKAESHELETVINGIKIEMTNINHNISVLLQGST